MKLLFDENLSPKLVNLLGELFPDSVHVRDVGLNSADDVVVWKYAQDHSLTICSKDSDMHQRSFVFGFPQKLCGCDWVIVQRVMWKSYCEYTLVRSRRLSQTIMPHFSLCGDVSSESKGA